MRYTLLVHEDETLIAAQQDAEPEPTVHAPQEVG